MSSESSDSEVEFTEHLFQIDDPKKRAAALYVRAKKLVTKQQYEKAMKALNTCIELHPFPKYISRRQQLKEFLEADEESVSEEEEDDYEVEQPVKHERYMEIEDRVNHLRIRKGEKLVELTKGLRIQADTFDKLYEYQKHGISWLYELYAQKKGGILADDMGLGKTIQTIVLLEALFDSNQVKTCLIIAPTTLLNNWRNEFNKWAPDLRIFDYHGTSIKRRNENLVYVQRSGGILVTTYGLASTRSQELSTFRGREFVWDYMILDEAHKVKNPIKTTKNLNAVPSRVRLGITGTPVQNNLKELWALYDFVQKGALFGTYSTYKSEFELPILRAREKGATPNAIRQGNLRAEALIKVYAPFFLRRTKDQVLTIRGLHDAPGSTGKIELPPKIDWAAWIHLTPLQIRMYQDFLKSPALREALKVKKSPLVHLVMLKKLCDHPRLLSPAFCNQLIRKKNSSLSAEEINSMMTEDETELAWEDVSDEQLIQESGKLRFLFNLLDELRVKKHRTLIFSQSLKMLNMIAKILKTRNYRFSRLDGTVLINKRPAIISEFQRDPSISIMLLTTQVGGVGLTLTAANSVVIYDPNWNPGTDSQAIDRAYRIGQQKIVYVYRLLTCGTVEEKIYRRQIYKKGLTEQTVEKTQDPTRYFSGDQLRELFKFESSDKSETYDNLEALHGHKRNKDPMITSLLDVVRKLPYCYNVSEHDQLYQIENDDINPDDVLETELEQMRHQAQFGVDRLRQEAELRERVYTEQNRFNHDFNYNIPQKLSDADNAAVAAAASRPEHLYPEVATISDDTDHLIGDDSVAQVSIEEYGPPVVPFSSVPEAQLVDIADDVQDKILNSSTRSRSDIRDYFSNKKTSLKSYEKYNTSSSSDPPSEIDLTESPPSSPGRCNNDFDEMDLSQKLGSTQIESDEEEIQSSTRLPANESDSYYNRNPFIDASAEVVDEVASYVNRETTNQSESIREQIDSESDSSNVSHRLSNTDSRGSKRKSCIEEKDTSGDDESDMSDLQFDNVPHSTRIWDRNADFSYAMSDTSEDEEKLSNSLHKTKQRRSNENPDTALSSDSDEADNDETSDLTTSQVMNFMSRNDDNSNHSVHFSDSDESEEFEKSGISIVADEDEFAEEYKQDVASMDLMSEDDGNTSEMNDNRKAPSNTQEMADIPELDGEARSHEAFSGISCKIENDSIFEEFQQYNDGNQNAYSESLLDGGDHHRRGKGVPQESLSLVLDTDSIAELNGSDGSKRDSSMYPNSGILRETPHERSYLTYSQNDSKSMAEEIRNECNSKGACNVGDNQRSGVSSSQGITDASRHTSSFDPDETEILESSPGTSFYAEKPCVSALTHSASIDTSMMSVGDEPTQLEEVSGSAGYGLVTHRQTESYNEEDDYRMNVTYSQNDISLGESRSGFNRSGNVATSLPKSSLSNSSSQPT